MVSSNKILTVSYGTFSCTAEGFEDPLAVVKETTQFFRGVVGEDRFFGAEPPQVDPELANELMRQQITAEAEGGQLTLRGPLAAGAASAGALTAALAAGAARPADAGQAPVLPDDDTIEATAEYIEREQLLDDYEEDEDDAEDLDLRNILSDDADDMEDVAAEDLAPEPAPAAETESVAAKLQRIRAVVDSNAAPATEAASEGSSLDDMLGALSDDADEDADDDILSGSISNLLDAEDDEEDNLFETGEDDPAEVPSAATYAAQGVDVAGYDDDFEDSDDLDEDDWDRLEGAPAPVSHAQAEDDDEDDALYAEDDGEDDEWEGFAAAASLPEDIDETDSADDFEDDLEDEAFDAPAPPAPEPPRPVAPVRARVVKVKREAFENAVASGQLEEIEEEDAPVPPVPGASSSSLSDDEEAELARELAAVKAELSGAMDDWDDEDDDMGDYAPEPRAQTTAKSDWDDEDEDEDDEDFAPRTQARSTSSWDDDDDDDDWDDDDFDDRPAASAPGPLRLGSQRQTSRRHWDTDLDHLDAKANRATAEVHGAVDEEDVIEGARKAVKMASPARAMLTEQRVEDNDTSRILDQTNEELEEPDGNRRRSAIAHLRAAVAATRADRLLGRGRNADEEAEPYREDLANVVRPRRPQPQPAERAPETISRPTPLKLVAEQRIGEEASQGAPVRPRRIERPSEPAPMARRDAPVADVEDGNDFAAYAGAVGAHDLPELIEAAAAFITFEMGRPEFSRPQLMTTLRGAEAVESSREDRLRLFGQLLREGKIVKTSGGRFTVSDSISFKPRRAVG